MQIRTRLTGLFFIIIAFLLLVTFYLIYFFSVKYEKQAFYSRLEKRAVSTVDLLIRVNHVDSTVLKLIDINKKDVLENENISVYDSNYKEIYTSNDSLHFHQYVPGFDQLIQSLKPGEVKLLEIESTQFVFMVYELNQKKYYVVASAIDIQGNIFFKNLKIILITTYFIILIIILITSWIFAGRALKPITKVIKDVKNIKADSLEQRLPDGKNKDEIAQLINTFNDLLSRIEKAIKTQKLFVTNASHELRNPLTAITSQIEVALLKKREDSEYESLLKSVLEDIKELNEMSHRLLQLSKIDSAENAIQFEKIRIDDIIWETKNEFLSIYPKYKMKLIVHTLPEDESKLNIRGNKQFLKTCFMNLLENACKFSNDHSVTAEIKFEKDFFTILISDKGVGINKEDLPHIFEPFYRSKKSSGTKGYGIGLSITYRIIQLHHAKIRVTSEQNSGTVFTIQIPRLTNEF